MSENNSEYINEQYTPLQPSWSNEPLQSDLVKDYDMAQSSHSLFLAKLDEYKVDYEGGKTINARVGKSTVRPRLIRKNLEWKFPALEEPFLNTADMYQIKGRTFEDEDAAMQNSLMLNYYWAIKVDKVPIVGSIVRTFGIEGTVFVKTGWNAVQDEIEVEYEEPVYASPEESLALMNQMVMSGEMDQATAQAMMEIGEPMQIGMEKKTRMETRLIENHPTYEVCDNTDVVVDPTCNGILSDAQFIIHEYELDLNTLKKQKQIVNADTGEVKGIYSNLKFIDFSLDHSDYDEYDSDSKTSFIFTDKTRKKVKVREYWGYWDIDDSGETTPIVATWIGKVMVRLEKNPFPHGELPFSSASYMPIKGEIYGEPDGALLKENQESIGKMTRAAHDITATQAIGQTLVNEQFFTSPSQWEAFKKGNDARFRADMDPRMAIHKVGVESVNNSVFQMIELQNNDAESLTGTKSFSSGVSGNALGDNVGGIRSALDATSKRELSILRRLADQLFKDMARKTIINMQSYCSEEETIRITNDEYVTVRREDLQGEFDLIVDVSTPEKDNEMANDLAMVLQTGAANMDPMQTNKVWAKICRLKKLPDLAEDFENAKPPEPTEAEMEMQQMQMANMKLEQQKLQMEIASIAKTMENMDANIVEKYSRVAENESDRVNKNAEADYRNAMAGKIRSETDVIDQSFVNETYKDSTAEKIAEHELKQIAEQNKATMQHDSTMIQKQFDIDNAKAIPAQGQYNGQE